MAVKFYLEKRPSIRTGECAIRASFPIKGVKLITTTGITINDANWGAEQDLEEKSVQKHFNNLRWFLYWALRKGYTQEDTIKRYRPKFKVLEKPIIFLTKEELLHLYHFEVSGNGTEVTLTDMYGKEYTKKVEDAGGLIKTRD